jgi:outer membrane protein
VTKVPEATLAILCCLAAACPVAMAQSGVQSPTAVDGRVQPATATEPQAATGTQVAALSTNLASPPHETISEDWGKATPQVRQLTLSEALAQAMKTQPTMRQARAQTGAAEGRVEQARAGYLPQIIGTAAYQRTTGNFVSRPGAIPSTAAGVVTRSPSPNLTTYDYFNFALTASQLIYDFGQTSGRWNAAESAVDSSVATEKATRLQTVLNVQSAFYQAWAQRALVSVAEETLTAQNRHLGQIDGFVKVGIRPEIDIAQARANVANARLQWINTQNAYEIAKNQLNAAIGVMTNTNFEVADERAPAVDGEDGPVEPLVARALESRPDITALERQHDTQTKTIRALRGAYGPSLVASTTATDQGTQLNNLVPNWNVGVTLTWPILQGGLTDGQVREAEANLQAIEAQRDALKIQVRVQVDQARLAIKAAKASIGAADDALTNARQQLKLAEGRYSSGIGSVIELTDAQVAYTNARAQVVQAHFNLSNSRAQLTTALGLR